MAGDWTADDLSGVLCAFAAHLRDVVPAALQRLRAVALRRPPASEDNTVAGARRNIQRHYDLSNDMFKVFLDESMTYSAALYNGDPAESSDELATAQRRKVDRLLDASQVHAGTRVLEIGTGWGELAIRAASRGAEVTSITNSAEQAALARERIAQAGLADRATVLLQDYRATTGRFDAVVSVEMVEAVGMNYWPDYFQTIDRALVPGGRAGLQAILQADDLMRATANTYTWIRKYIFPGGALMSAEALHDTHYPPHWPALARPLFLRPALRRDAAPMAGQLRGAERRHCPARIRRDVPTDVVVLPGVFGVGISHRMPRRQPDLPSEAGPRSPRIIPSRSALPPR